MAQTCGELEMHRVAERRRGKEQGGIGCEKMCDPSNGRPQTRSETALSGYEPEMQREGKEKR